MALTVFTNIASLNAQRRLEIMRDPHLGAFGAAALVFVLIGKISALSALDSDERVCAILISATLARMLAVAACAMFQYARLEGLGAAYIGRAGWPHAVVSLAAPAALGFYFHASMIPFAVSALAGLSVAFFSNRSLGGITGDVLGAVIEISECAALMAFAAMR